jgi:PST family polysaccharide transporter
MDAWTTPGSLFISLRNIYQWIRSTQNMNNVKRASIFFDTSHLDKDLKKRSLQGGAVTVLAKGVQLLIQLGSTMVLARILTPGDYGIMAMVMAVGGMAGLFQNLGLSTATIQQADINHAQVSTLFWINASMGFLLMLLMAGLSPVVAWFYAAPELAFVTLALSVNFLLDGLTVQHDALLNRQMRFFSLAAIQVLSMLAGILVAIFAAMNGFGYWALVLNSIVNTICSVSGKLLIVKWIPGLPKRGVGVGSMIKFGADLVGFNIVNYFSRNLDNVLIGRFHGSGPLGMYSKAYQLLMMPITNLRDPMTRVAMPALSRLQNEPENYRNYYMKFVSILAFISMPLVAFLFVCSDQLINIILGPQWMEASAFFKILAVVAFIHPVSTTWGLVLISTGRSRRYLKWGIVNSIVIVISFAIGVFWGAKGVAIAYVFATYLLLYPTLRYSFKNTPVKVKDFIISVWKPMIASILIGVICFFILNIFQGYNDLLLIIICFFSILIIYPVVLLLISGGLHNIREYYQYFRLILLNK